MCKHANCKSKGYLIAAVRWLKNKKAIRPNGGFNIKLKMTMLINGVV